MTRTISLQALLLLLAACSTAEVGGTAGGTTAVAVQAAVGLDDGRASEAARSLDQGLAHFHAGRYAQALTSFRSAALLDPLSRDAANGIGASFDMMGRHELAQVHYRRLLEQFPEDAQILNNLGFSLLLQGQPERAERYLKAARALGGGGEPDGGVIGANAQLAAYLADRREGLASSQARPTVGNHPAMIGSTAPIYRVITRGDAADGQDKGGPFR